MEIWINGTIESRKIELYLHGDPDLHELIFGKDKQAFLWRKGNFLNRWTWPSVSLAVLYKSSLLISLYLPDFLPWSAIVLDPQTSVSIHIDSFISSSVMASNVIHP